MYGLCGYKVVHASRRMVYPKTSPVVSDMASVPYCGATAEATFWGGSPTACGDLRVLVAVGYPSWRSAGAVCDAWQCYVAPVRNRAARLTSTTCERCRASEREGIGVVLVARQGAACTYLASKGRAMAPHA